MSLDPVRLRAPMVLLVMWALLLLPARLDAAVSLLVPDGPLVAGAENRILVVNVQDGLPVAGAAPALAAEPAGPIVSEGRLRDGVHGFRYAVPPTATGSVVFTVGTGAGGLTRVSVPVATTLPPPLDGPRRVEATAGSEKPIPITLTAEDLPDPDDVAVEATEGEVLAVTRTDQGLQVSFRQANDRHPRIAVLGVRDLRKPNTPPKWIPIRLVGRPQIPIRAEPGASIWLSVRGRTVGPFVADAQGEAQATLEVAPGDQTAAIRIEDRLGNVQHGTLNLQPEAAPILAAMADSPRIPGSPPSPVYVIALDPSGTPWSGAQPECRSLPGGPLARVPLGGSQYRVAPAIPREGDYLEIRVTCEIPGTEARVRLRIAAGEGIPSSLGIRLYPEALSADFPVAQVQVTLEDRRGERLPAAGVQVGADLGQVTVDENERGTLRAEYNGARAAAAGTDRVWARFQLPSGNGPPAHLTVAPGPFDATRGTLLVQGRLLDATGLPLPAARILLSAGGQPTVTTTDARGWARAEVPLDRNADLVVLEARLEGLVSRTPYFPRAPGAPPSTEGPDLEATFQVPIVAGRVREVFINASPAVIESGPTSASRVTVRLVDRFGNAVTDESVHVLASAGEMGTLRARPDGTYEAWYRPPGGLRSGVVRITAQGKEGAFAASTDINILPRPLSQALGIAAGYQTNFGSINSIIGEIHLESRLPLLRDSVVLRMSGGHYADHTSVIDTTTGEVVAVRTRMNPLGTTLLVRSERNVRAGWLGAGLVVLLWHTETTFAEEPALPSTGLAGPGFVLVGGMAWRVGAGEVGLEVHYLQASTPAGAIRYTGQVGGVGLLGSYRVLF